MLVLRKFAIDEIDKVFLLLFVHKKKIFLFAAAAGGAAASPRMADGVRGGIRTHGPRIRTTSACAAAPIAGPRSWSGLSLHPRLWHHPKPLDAARPVSTPSPTSV